MEMVRKAVTTLGGIFLAALAIAALMPKATRGVVAALVQVVNPPSNPANVVNAPANPFHGRCTTSETLSFTLCNISVPAGKRLVIQSASVLAATSPGVRVLDGVMIPVAAGSFYFANFGILFYGGDGFTDYSETTFDLHAYHDGGAQPLQCEIQYNQVPARSFVDCEVSGYLVDMP